MNHTFSILEFDKIINQLEECALTQAAKDKIRKLEPYLAEKDARMSLRETTQSRTIIDNMGLPPAVSMEGLDHILITVSQGGLFDCRGAGNHRHDSGCRKPVKGFSAEIQVFRNQPVLV